MSEVSEDLSLIETPSDSLKKRYLFKIVSNFVGLLSNIFVQAIAPRSLGPQAFGDFNFITNFFDQVLEMVDGRSSVGALVKVSLRPRETALVVFYLYFSLVASLFVFFLLGLSFYFGLDQIIWPGQMMKFIALGALWSVLVWLHGVLHKLCDAFGFTREAEWVRIQQKVLSVALLGAMVIWSEVTLESFFYYYIFLLLYLLLGFWGILIWRGKWPGLREWRLPLDKFQAYTREFFVYSSPLFVYVAVEAIVAVIDRWILQRFSGSAEQGYFGFAYQMGYISVLFVGAISPLIQREFSVAFASKNFTHMAYLFRRYMPMMFSIAAFFTGFIVFQSDKLIHLFAGHKFSESSSVITVMAFYPIYFTFGRVTSSVFYATGETQLFRNLGLMVHGAGLVLSWILIAPIDHGGLGWGADGLAWKLVIVQAILVNIQVWFSCRMLRVKFVSYINHQLISLAGFLSLGYVAYQSIDSGILVGDVSDLEKFLVAGCLYCGTVAIITYAMPGMFGILRSDVVDAARSVLRLTPLGGEFLSGNKSEMRLSRIDSSRDQLVSNLRVVIIGARNSIHAVRWANAMAERGHEVHFISLHPRDSEVLHSSIREHKLYFSSSLGIFAYFLNVPQMARLLKRISPTTIHVHYASGYGTLAALSTRKKYILSAWGSDIFDIPKRSLFYRFFVRLGLKRAGAVTAASEVLGLACLSEMRGDGLVFVLPFGVDTELFCPGNRISSKKIRIGSIKSLEPIYGIDVLVRAFAQVVSRAKQEDKGLEFELILVGKGEQTPLIKAMVESLGIADITQFRGSLPHSQIPKVLGEMDIFVAPSRSESFGVAIIEASATGIPVVASRVGGIPEVVENGVTGLLVKPDRVGELAESLWRLAIDSGYRDELGRAGRKRVIREFSWQANVAGMEGLYLSYGNI